MCFSWYFGENNKERWILWCGAVNCQEENQEVAEVSSPLIPSAALVIFMKLGSSLPTLPHQVRLQRVFFPLKIPLKLFDCNWIWEIKSQYFCLVVWDLSLCLFPKVIWHSGSTHQSCLSYHKICFLSHSLINFNYKLFPSMTCTGIHHLLWILTITTLSIWLKRSTFFARIYFYFFLLASTRWKVAALTS